MNLTPGDVISTDSSRNRNGLKPNLKFRTGDGVVELGIDGTGDFEASADNIRSMRLIPISISGV